MKLFTRDIIWSSISYGLFILLIKERDFGQSWKIHKTEGPQIRPSDFEDYRLVCYSILVILTSHLDSSISDLFSDFSFFKKDFLRMGQSPLPDIQSFVFECLN